MATKKKIFIRLALLTGAGYIIYRNKDRIVGKFNKLSRMGTVDEMVDDVSKTANSALDGVIDMVEEGYEYVFNGEQVGEGLNTEFQKEINREVVGLEPNYGTQLKQIASHIVLDIRGWDNKEYEISDMAHPGKMPVSPYIRYYNFLNLKGEGDFNRVFKIANIMLQYKAPYEKKSDTIKDTKLPTLDYYIANPPLKYTQYNEIDNTIYESTGRKAPYFSLKPKDLFRVLGDKIRNENIGSSLKITPKTNPDIYTRK